MKKTLFRSVLLLLFACVGLSGARAQANQRPIEVVPMKADIQTLANSVIEYQMTDPDKANDNYSKLMRKIRNDKNQLISVGTFFLDHNVFLCARQCGERAYSLDAQNMNALVLQAEVYMASRQYGQAGQKFDEILMLDSTNMYAMRNSARVYKHVNPTVSMEMFEKIRTIEPNNYDAAKNLGDICYEELSEYPKAVSYYETYYKEVPHTKDDIDIRACENYLLSLYAVAAADGAKSNEYAKRMVDIVNEVQPFDPDNLVFKRMRFFADLARYNSSMLSADLNTAHQSASYIVNKEHEDSLYLYLDYYHIAKLYNELQKYDEAVEYMQKALAIDSTKVDGYKELADNLASAGRSDEAIVEFSKYLDKLGDRARNADYFKLARMYGAAAAAAFKAGDMEKQANLITKLDATLDKVEALNPGNVGIAVTRAQLHVMDGTKPQDDVKALYEEVLRRAAGKEGYEDQEAQAYQYLLFYDIKHDNYDSARINCNELLKRNPNDDMGKQGDAYLKSMGK